MGDKTERTCEGWYGGCGAPATKSVQTVGEHGCIVIWFCQRHCGAFQTDTVERGEDEVK
jgi:hypothetical protein